MSSEALRMEVPNIYLEHLKICLYTIFRLNQVIGAGNNHRNPKSALGVAGEALRMKVPNIYLENLKMCFCKNFSSIESLVLEILPEIPNQP